MKLTQRRWLILLCMAVCILSVTAVANGATTKREVRFTVWGGVETLDTFQNIINRFEKANPDIKVKLEFAGEFAAYFQKLLVQLASGTAPDVMRMSGAYFVKLAEQQAFLDLTPMIKRDRINLEREYFSTMGIFDLNGRTYALPQGGDVTGLFYNRSMFAAAGLEEPSASWNWETLKSNGKKFTADLDGDNKIDRYGYDLVIANTQWGWFNYILQAGITPLNKEKTQSQMATKEAIGALQFMQSLYSERVSPKPNELGVFDTFAPEKVAMTNRLIPAQFSYWDKLKLDWDVAPLPKGQRMATQSNWIGWTVNRASKDPAAAWEFTKFLAKEGAWDIARQRDMIPGLRAAALSKEFMDSGKPSRLSDVLQTLTQYSYDLQFTPSWAEWTAAVNQLMTKLANETISPETAAVQINNAINTILADERR